MKTIRISAAIIRDEAGRFLLVRKRGSEIFFQPGGKIDDGEDRKPASCARSRRNWASALAAASCVMRRKWQPLPPTKRMRRWKPSFTILRWRKGRCPSPPARLRNCGGTRRATPRGRRPSVAGHSGTVCLNALRTFWKCSIAKVFYSAASFMAAGLFGCVVQLA